MKKYTKKQIEEFLTESNAIEVVFGRDALKDAMKAWDYLSSKRFLTPEVILATHNFLMRNLRPDIAGNWRTCAVFIGGEKKTFESTQRIEGQVERFCLAMSITAAEIVSNTMDKERLTKDAHVIFEEIHPFEDGNGRVGRLIYLWHRMNLMLPIHIIHADWPDEDGEQRSYYKWFKKLDK